MIHRTPRENYADHLVKVADHLNEQQDAILQTWRANVVKDSEMAVACSLSQEQFEAGIPALLQFLNREIRSESILLCHYQHSNQTSENVTLTPKEHWVVKRYSHKRWEQGYELRSLILELRHLNLTLVRMLNEFEVTLFMHKPGDEFKAMIRAIAIARILITQFCDAIYLPSILEFQQLQQSQARETVRNLSQALGQAVQWEHTRGQVLREAIHDLRGNLTAILGATSLLDVDQTDLEIQRAIFALLKKGTQTLYQMLTDLLDLSRLESGHEERQVEPFDAAVLIYELCQTYEALAVEKEITLSYLGPSNLWIESDVIKVRRVTQNLLLNALKYTLQGGIIIHCEDLGPHYWRLSVEDTGPGFSQESRDALGFGSFSQHDNSEEDSEPDIQPLNAGEGVGLAIVKRLCILLEAEIKMDTAPGRGTTFHIVWPRHYPVAGSSKGDAEPDADKNC